MPAKRADGKRATPPKYGLHKASGQAIVYIDRKPVYLGQYGSAESWERYKRIVDERLGLPVTEPVGAAEVPADVPADLTMTELCLRYMRHVKAEYGLDSSTASKARSAIKALAAFAGPVSVARFRAKTLKHFRQWMVTERDWSRTYINQQIKVVQAIMKWAASEELLDGSQFDQLMAVDGLRRGRGGARETEPVKPVPEAHIEAVLPHLSRQAATMMQLQRLTGMRPGEAVLMRAIDLDTSGRIWTYAPAKFKGDQAGRSRTIYLGPRAQELVKPFLAGRAVDAYLFDPREALAEAAAKASGHRRPDQPTNPKRTSRRVRERFDVGSYRQAIHRGCDAAWPVPAELARQRVPGRRGTRQETEGEWRKRLGPERWAKVKAWRAEHRINPHQLRHNAATEVRREFGLEAAQVWCGHSTADVTQVYAERDESLALKIAERVG